MSRSDDSDVYQSDEEVRCILHMSSSSSSSEEPETDFKDAETPLLITPSAAQISLGDLTIHPEDVKSQLASRFPLIIHRLNSLWTKDMVDVHLSFSFSKDWELPGKVPTNIICDACIISPIRPVILMTFRHKSEKDRSVKYNTKIARHLITSVRKHLFPSFTVVSGVIDKEECSADETFQSRVKKLNTEASITSVPSWLYMDDSKYHKLQDFFRKMVPTHDCKDGDGIVEKGTVNDPQAIDSNRVSDQNGEIASMRNGSKDLMQKRDSELLKMTGEHKWVTAVLKDTVTSVDRPPDENKRVFVEATRCSSKLGQRQRKQDSEAVLLNLLEPNRMVATEVFPSVPYDTTLLDGLSKEISNEGENKSFILKSFTSNKMASLKQQGVNEKYLTGNLKLRRTMSDTGDSKYTGKSGKDKSVRRNISFNTKTHCVQLGELLDLM